MKREMTATEADHLWSALVRAAVRRMPGMVAVWAGFGVTCGVLTAPGTGPVAITAGVIAGLIVLTPFGIALALAGGKWRDSLVGGAFGLALVPLAAWAGVSTGTSLVPVGLVFGGIVGATVVTACYRLPRLVLAAARPLPASGRRVEKPVAV
jgi:hypothetical protein